MRRLYVALMASLTCIVVAAASAYGKGDVHARLAHPAQLQRVAAGERVRIAWTLSEAPNRPRSGPARVVARPFGASGVYVRLHGASGATRETVPARSAAGAGRYVADVTIPAGGISSIAIGLKGMRFVRGQTPVRADVFFPIDNNPFTATSPDADADAPGNISPRGSPPSALCWPGIAYGLRRGVSAPAG